jgi:hypothetical protein
VGTFEHTMEPLVHPKSSTLRVSGFDSRRSTQRVLGHQTLTSIAMEKQRKEK